MDFSPATFALFFWRKLNFDYFAPANGLFLMINFKFHSGERLKGKQLIKSLFEKGSSKGFYPLRLVWLHSEKKLNQYPVRVAFGVSRRNFKTAVKRNTLKRRMREAWRLHKDEVYEAQKDAEGHIALMIIYTGKEEKAFDEIEKSVKRAIRKLPEMWLTNP